VSPVGFAASGQGILDTSGGHPARRLEDPTALPAEPLITAVTLAELAIGPLVGEEGERASRQVHLQLAEAAFEPLAFDAGAARAFGGVSASLRRAGRKTAARTSDAMIAATTIANGPPVYTRNPDDFSGIDGLEVIAVPVPA
jgi:tRNA(fMet)-specific endonuclease VapC